MSLLGTLIIILCILGIILLAKRPEEQNNIIITPKKVRQPKHQKISKVTIDEMVLHDMNNDNDTYDIGQINL